MTSIAIEAVDAAVFVVKNEVSWAPIRTCDGLVVVLIGLASIVLPVMSVDTKCFVMLCEVEGTPD